MNPSACVHHAAEPLEYWYVGGTQAVARVWIGWSLEEQADSAHSGSKRNVDAQPYGVAIVYNGQMVTFWEKTHSNVGVSLGSCAAWGQCESSERALSGA